MGTPIWSHDGIICTGESYKNVVKLTFAKGASLKDSARLFNSSLDGNVPVQAYIAAMPGWKSAVGRRLDAIITRSVPGVRKAVKWNSPFYGVEGQGWFLNAHCFTKYIKVAFFRGVSLRPVPPGESKHKEVRYLDIHEDDKLDEKQLATWIKQAASIPGWDGGSPRSGGSPL